VQAQRPTLAITARRAMHCSTVISRGWGVKRTIFISCVVDAQVHAISKQCRRSLNACASPTGNRSVPHSR
jgi:hypothetical protein